MYKLIELNQDGETDISVGYVGVHPLNWPGHIGPPAAGFAEVDGWVIFERAIKTMTLVMQEIEQGCPNWSNRGGQSYGWKVLYWLEKRYNVPYHVQQAVVNGYVRWI